MSALMHPDGFARDMPKAEIHLHLEGAVPVEALLRILQGRGEPIDPAGRARLEALYRHRDFLHFLSNFRELCGHLRSPEEFGLITGLLSARLRQEGVRYAEVMCSPLVFTRAGLPLQEIMEAVGAAARRGRADGGPRLRFLFDGVRQFGPGAFEELVDMASACGRHDVIGVGLGGDERSIPASEFAAAYAEARRRGLKTTVHAGEFDGPRSVWEAVEVLQVDRIGHGIRAAEDAVLTAMLARRRVPLECCPTSNLRTGVVADWPLHPAARLHRAGVAVTVNSDDPAMFGSWVADEWEVLGRRLRMTPREILEVGLCTARSTFLPEADREALAGEMQDAARAAGVES